jgi:hypothetical protein
VTTTQTASVLGTPLFARAFSQFSDNSLYGHAEKFVKTHKCKITSSQISGLVSVSGTTGRVDNVLQFCRHQADKAKYSDLRQFWSDLAAKIKENVDVGIKTLKLLHGISVEGPEAQELELLIVIEFIRHLRAEYTFNS